MIEVAVRHWLPPRLLVWVVVASVGCVGATASQLAHAAPANANKEAEKLAKTARTVYEQGQFAAAAELYRKAYRLNPTKPDYLYGVGKAEQKAGRLAQAKAALEQLLALIPADDPLAERARKALAEVAAALAPAAPAKAAPEAPPPPPPAAPPAEPAKPAEIQKSQPAAAEPPRLLPPTPVIQVPPPAMAQPQPGIAVVALPSRTPALATLAGAGVALVGAGSFAMAALQADSDADRYRVAGTVQFDPAKLSGAAALSIVQDINTKWQLSAACGGLAVVTGAVGAYLWVRSGRTPVGTLATVTRAIVSRATVSSDGQSLLLSMAF